MNTLDMSKNEMIQKIKELEEIKNKYNKDKSRCKKWYSSYYMKEETSLTDEEQKTKEERINKRRAYMNARYQKIYKPKKQQLKSQLSA
jgi:ribosomal protein L14E/L6E/L27E